MRLVLIGFMGSGKTTLGSRVAERVGVPFIDLDTRIEQDTRRTIREIFEQDGEREFRRLELAVLRRTVAQAPARLILATGGGVVETKEAHPLLVGLGRIVWLDADPEVCMTRIDTSRGRRPLLDTPHDGPARAHRRDALYRKLANATVRTHPETVEESQAQLEALFEAPTRG